MRRRSVFDAYVISPGGANGISPASLPRANRISHSHSRSTGLANVSGNDYHNFTGNWGLAHPLAAGESTFTSLIAIGTLSDPPDQRLVSVYLSNWVFEPLEPGQTVSQPVRPALLSPDPVPSRPPQ